MATFNKEKFEVVRQNFTVKSALDQEAFMDFHHAFPDSASVEGDTDTMKERYDLFMDKNEVAPGLKEALKPLLAKELKGAVPTSELGSVDAYLERICREAPHDIATYLEKIKISQEQTKKIAELEQKIQAIGTSAELNSKKEKLDEKKDLLKTANRSPLFFWLRGKKKEAREKLKTDYGYADDLKGVDVRAELKKLGASTSELEKSSKIVTRFEKTRDVVQGGIDSINASILDKAAGMGEIQEMARNLAKKKIERMLSSSKDIASLKKTEAYIKELQNSNSKLKMAEGIGMDDFNKKAQAIVKKNVEDRVAEGKKNASIRSLHETLDFIKSVTESKGMADYGAGLEIDKLEQDITETVAKIVDQKLVEAVKSMKKGDGVISQFESRINDIVVNGRIGTKEAMEVDSFMIETLNQILDNLDKTPTPDSKIKMSAVRQVILKIENK